jgi:hypothetical protein
MNNKTDRYDIAEILLKVALNTITLSLSIQSMLRFSSIYMYFDSSMKFDIWSKAKSYKINYYPRLKGEKRGK